MNSYSGKITLIVALTFFVSIFGAFLLVGSTFFTKEIFAFTSFSPTLQNTTPLTLKESIIVTFPKPVLDRNYRERIRISPSQPFYAKWEENKTQLILTPQTHWVPETHYTLLLPEGLSSNPFSSTPESASLTFQTISRPSIKNVFPADKAENVIIDIEDPIVVEFNESTQDYWIDFIFSPAIEVTFQNNPEKTRFEILPKTALIPGISYTFTIRSHIKGTENSPLSDPLLQTKFTTFLPVPENLSEDPIERLEQAKKFTRPQIVEGKYIDITLDTQIMVIFEDGIALDAYLVSSGKRGMDTPQGTFQIHNKAPKPWSKAYSLFMPHWMAITSDGKYGIHELPEWPGGYKEGADHLGTPVSHGCVRLGVGSAERVYNWTEVGTPVVVH